VIGSNIYKNFGFGFSQMLVLTEGTSKTKIYQSISILIEVSKKMYRPFLVILLLEIIFVHIPTIQQFRYLKIPLIAILFTLSCWKKKRDVLTKDLKLDFLILLEYVTFSTAITLIIGVWNIRIILGVALAVIIGTASPLPFGLGLREILMVGLLKSEVSTTVIIYASAVSRSIQLIIEILIGIPILLRNIKLDRKLDTW
jgi:hypothetical protein